MTLSQGGQLQKQEDGISSFADSDQQRYEPEGECAPDFYNAVNNPITPEIAKEILTWPSTHHQGGISVFHNALDVSQWDALEPWMEVMGIKKGLVILRLLTLLGGNLSN